MATKSKGEIIGIIAIKGGVGKTTTVVNLAVSLANDLNKKVLVIDANFSSPNLALQLGLADYDTNLHMVLNDEILIQEAIYKHDFGFDVIPGSLTSKKISPLKLKRKIAILRKYYDYIVLDSSPTLNEEILSAMQASDKLFVVTSPDYTTLSTTLRAVKLAKEKGTPILGLIMNKVMDRKYELSQDQIESMARTPVIATLHENQKVLEALAAVQPVTLYAPHNKVSLEFRRLAHAIADEDFVEPSLKERFMNHLKEDIDSFKQHDFKSGLRYYK